VKYRIFTLLLLLFFTSHTREVWSQSIVDTMVNLMDSIDISKDLSHSQNLESSNTDSVLIHKEMVRPSINEEHIINRISESRLYLDNLEDQIKKKSIILNSSELSKSIILINQTSSIELSSSSDEIERLSEALSSLRDDETLTSELEYIEESIIILEESINRIKIEYPEEDLSGYTFGLQQLEYSSYDCVLTSDSTNINSITYSTEAAPLFSYTHPKLKPHFIGKDYMSTSAQIIESNSKYFILLSIEIKSNRAKETFGGLEKGEILRLQLINGEKIIAYNMRRSFGEYNSETNTTSFTPVYSIKKDNLKKISKIELDKIGLMWTTGYEDYEVFEMDFFMNQGTCILN